MGFVTRRRSGHLGDYYDGIHTWHYDATAGGYVDENGNPSVASAAAAQPAATPTNFTYSAGTNADLYQNVTGAGFDGSTQHLNSNFYATQEAAARYAAVLGGQVIVDPTSARFSTSQPMYAVKLPNGTTVNAGAIAQILENDAAYGNDNVKSGEIAKLFGAAYQPGLAESLRQGNTAVQLTAAAPAPGYNPTPLNQSIADKAKTAAAVAAQLPAPIAAAVETIAQQASTLPSWALPAAAAVAVILFMRRN